LDKNKISTVILGISLVFVLFLSSISVSFGSFVGSPNYQLESGVTPEDISCRNNLVLVLRTNGNPACVQDSTSKQFGWEKIEKHSQLVMDTADIPFIDVELDPLLYSGAPISSKMIEPVATTDSSISVEPTIFPSDKEIIISSLPRVGDIIDVTFIATYQPTQPHTFENAMVAFHVTDTLEFLTIPEGYVVEYTEPQSSWGKQYLGIYSLKAIDPVIFDSDVPQKFTVQVKALSEGVATISAGVFDEQAKIDLVIGSTETLLRNDYYVKYPQEIPESIQLPTSPEEQIEFTQQHGTSFGTTTITTDITESEFRIWLKNYGLSENEINELIARAFPNNGE